MLGQIVRTRDAARARIQQAEGELAVALEVFTTLAAEWRVGFDGHSAAFAQAKERAEAHRQQLEQIEGLSVEIQQLDQQINDTVAQRDAVGFNPDDEESNRRRWSALHRERGDLLDSACARLREQSDGDIRAVLRRGADAKHAFERLKDRLGGSRARQDWLDSLSGRIIEAVNPADEWTTVLNEFRHLAEVPSELAQSADVPACPALLAAGFTDQTLRRVTTLLDMDGWLELSLISLEDKPEFFFQTGDSSEMPFESASPGQQATALLTVLLNQPGGPLLIDQPEDDLDNAIINRIVETIWSAKEKRQLIFSSHNANLVVNGDAELVIQCDYYSSKSRSAGRIRRAGSIEEPDICDAIKEVMEGGEKAFELRKAKYGF